MDRNLKILLLGGAAFAAYHYAGNTYNAIQQLTYQFVGGDAIFKDAGLQLRPKVKLTNASKGSVNLYSFTADLYYQMPRQQWQKIGVINYLKTLAIASRSQVVLQLPVDIDTLAAIGLIQQLVTQKALPGSFKIIGKYNTDVGAVTVNNIIKI